MPGSPGAVGGCRGLAGDGPALLQGLNSSVRVEPREEETGSGLAKGQGPGGPLRPQPWGLSPLPIAEGTPGPGACLPHQTGWVNPGGQEVWTSCQVARGAS